MDCDGEGTNCYSPSKGLGSGRISNCNKSCLGGCFGPNQDQCYACKNVYWNSTSRGHDCLEKCPLPVYYLVSGEMIFLSKWTVHNVRLFFSMRTGGALPRASAKTSPTTSTPSPSCQRRCPTRCTRTSALEIAHLGFSRSRKAKDGHAR